MVGVARVLATRGDTYVTYACTPREETSKTRCRKRICVDSILKYMGIKHEVGKSFNFLQTSFVCFLLHTAGEEPEGTRTHQERNWEFLNNKPTITQRSFAIARRARPSSSELEFGGRRAFWHLVTSEALISVRAVRDRDQWE